VGKSSQSWLTRGDNKLLYEFLPQDSSWQRDSLQDALHAVDKLVVGSSAVTLMDLGCGSGASYDAFSIRQQGIRWIGLDIIDSQEVSSRPRRKLPFCSYDGVLIPLADRSIDIVYSQQVFEHVRHPELLIREVNRVLRPGGFFIGSTSHLEPFHSRSYWNYTPYGFCVLLREAGFGSIQVRPGIDSLTLIGRRCLSYVKLTKLLEPFFRIESPMNVFLEIILRLIGQPASGRNALKLLFAGQFCFFARK
jgi:SAM-dependent methyltransferase